MNLSVGLTLFITAFYIIATRIATHTKDAIVFVASDDTHEEEGEEEEEDDSDADIDPKGDVEWLNETDPLTGISELQWLPTAVRDIAYYLRAHKFNDFDRRVYENETIAPRTFFMQFPDPALRSLHPEVRKYCDISFVECVDYLYEKIKDAKLRRDEDVITITRKNKWSLPNNMNEISEAEEECKKSRRLDWVNAEPFLGTLDRFQWRTSASYFMCWYTMLEEPNLRALGEPCDNFANCFDPDFRDSNRDPRADDSLPFQCATYSFCPDPCCPMKHYHNLEECWPSQSNPCKVVAPDHHPQCEFKRSENTDFESMALNRWNVTCECSAKGYEWDSRFRTCIDVDECVRGSHSCTDESEACFNVAGSYNCGCQWGYVFDADKQKCVQNEAIAIAKAVVDRNIAAREQEEPGSIVKKIITYLSGGNAAASE